MNLTTRIISRISLALLIAMAIWATLFYYIIVDEINDETDDRLQSHSEYIITRNLAGEKLPEENNGTNDSYHITEVSPEYAANNSSIVYYDEIIYIEAKKETEPARVLKTIYKNKDNKYFELRVAIPTIEKEDLQEMILIWIVLLYCTLLLIIIIINWWVLRKSFKPLYSLLKWLDNFSVDKKITDPIINTNVSEFKKLKDSIIRSAHRNIETYEQQKLFIGNASHELQTPLAVCLNRLEMLLEDPELNKKQLEEIYKIKKSINSLIKLNKTLLLLTKIENNQYPEKEEVNINQLIKGTLDMLSEIYNDKHISISIKEEALLKINMSHELASILFNNLLKNAFIHNHKKGTIHIIISGKEISISNTGQKEPLDSTAIFERFYQGNKKENSAGLGLALSKSISNYYKMDLKYKFENDFHTIIIYAKNRMELA